MSAFLSAAWDLRYLLALIVGLCVGAVITLSVEAARERRVRDALLLASLRDLPPADTDAPIRDRPESNRKVAVRMTHNWKPGDVAKSRYGVVFKTERGWCFDDGSGPNGPETESYPPADLRPLVVIDPEDREQVERLAVSVQTARGGIIFDLVPHMQAALRESANPTPPKPEEPADPAVRVFADGLEWARIGDWWVTSAMDECSRLWDWLVERDDFRVLSEGVTP